MDPAEVTLVFNLDNRNKKVESKHSVCRLEPHYFIIHVSVHLLGLVYVDVAVKNILTLHSCLIGKLQNYKKHYPVVI